MAQEHESMQELCRYTTVSLTRWTLDEMAGDEDRYKSAHKSWGNNFGGTGFFSDFLPSGFLYIIIISLYHSRMLRMNDNLERWICTAFVG